MNKVTVRGIVVLCWMVLIFALSHESSDGSQLRSDTLVDILQMIGLGGSADILSAIVRKSAHVIAYAVLGGLLVWTLTAKRKVAVMLVVCSVALACLYAISDEFHQSFIPGRSAEVRDVAIDTLGAVTGAYVTAWSIVRLRRGR